jgi:hypothetical protein
MRSGPYIHVPQRLNAFALGGAAFTSSKQIEFENK